MDFERAFVKAGTPLEAIKIASFNGARFPGEDAPGSAGVPPATARIQTPSCAYRLDRGRQASRFDDSERKPGTEHQRNRKGRNRLQGWSGLRLGEADPVSSGAGGNPVKLFRKGSEMESRCQ